MEVLPKFVQDYVKKYVGIPNCFNIARRPSKDFLQYAGVRLTEFLKEHALSLAANLSVVPLSFCLIVPAVS